MDYVKTICIDFDGVIHSYKSRWQGIGVAKDPPVPGALEWLQGLVDDPEFDPVIYSSRSKDPIGLQAMRKFFERNGFDHHQLSFPCIKPAAFLTIDDRALCFSGIFPCKTQMSSFKAWNKR